mmetsp:Transcript_5032/g.12149  ORF Transcript_5032/g.12149 Transcript_5032/m.12149 type:complete len:262 (+) Transcript_5032:685-1470(+)
MGHVNFPNLDAACAAYVAACQICARVNRGRISYAPSTRSVVDRAMEWVYVDCFAMRPSTMGYTSVILFIDFFSKFVWLYPTKGDADMSTYLNALLDLVGNFGIPTNLTTDNAKVFVAGLVKRFLIRSGTSQHTITPYYHPANGPVEPSVGIARAAAMKTCLELCSPISERPLILPLARLCINVRWSTVTGTSPLCAHVRTQPLPRPGHKCASNLRAQRPADASGGRFRSNAPPLESVQGGHTPFNLQFFQSLLRGLRLQCT